MPLRSRALTVAILALAAVTLAACGHKKDVVTEAKTEGPYLDVGPLQYQVQVSRQLNPNDTEDSAYFRGMTPQQLALKPDETWFGVFIRVQNDTGSAHRSAQEFSIEDTAGKKFEPVALPADNPFAYQPILVPSKATNPPEQSAAGGSAIAGSLVLFKLTLTSLANRPLVLRIKSPLAPPREAEVDLDV